MIALIVSSSAAPSVTCQPREKRAIPTLPSAGETGLLASAPPPPHLAVREDEEDVVLSPRPSNLLNGPADDRGKRGGARERHPGGKLAVSEEHLVQPLQR